jgi:hypothetical protein
MSFLCLRRMLAGFQRAVGGPLFAGLHVIRRFAVNVLAPRNELTEVPKAPLARGLEHNNDGPAIFGLPGRMVAKHRQAVNVFSGECANPGSIVGPLILETAWDATRCTRNPLDVTALQPDADKTLRVVVKIPRPIVTYKVMQVYAALPPPFQKRPSVKVRRAALPPVDFFGLAEQTIQKLSHLPILTARSSKRNGPIIPVLAGGKA